MTAPRVVAGTLQLSLQSVERTRNYLAEPPGGSYVLVAVTDGEVIGNLDLRTHLDNPRRRHVGGIGMAVRDDWQGRGIGTALMEAALDLADSWLDLRRIELTIYDQYTQTTQPVGPSTRGSGSSSRGLTAATPSEKAGTSTRTPWPASGSHTGPQRARSLRVFSRMAPFCPGVAREAERAP